VLDVERSIVEEAVRVGVVEDAVGMVDVAARASVLDALGLSIATVEVAEMADRVEVAAAATGSTCVNERSADSGPSPVEYSVPSCWNVT
jgi:hypothetical protein